MYCGGRYTVKDTKACISLHEMVRCLAEVRSVSARLGGKSEEATFVGFNRRDDGHDHFCSLKDLESYTWRIPGLSASWPYSFISCVWR